MTAVNRDDGGTRVRAPPAGSARQLTPQDPGRSRLAAKTRPGASQPPAGEGRRFPSCPTPQPAPSVGACRATVTGDAPDRSSNRCSESRS